MGATVNLIGKVMTISLLAQDSFNGRDRCQIKFSDETQTVTLSQDITGYNSNLRNPNAILSGTHWVWSDKLVDYMTWRDAQDAKEAPEVAAQKLAVKLS